MAGVRNQARLAAQLRLRRQVARQDELVRAYFAAEAAVEQAARRLAAVRAQCESRVGQAESARDDSARTLAAALAKVAVELGEERAAEILEVPLSRVRTARRSSSKSDQGKPGTGRGANGAVPEEPAVGVQEPQQAAPGGARRKAASSAGLDDGANTGRTIGDDIAGGDDGRG